MPKSERAGEVELVAMDIARLIKSALPSGVGFVLNLFENHKGGWSTYLSTVSRAQAAQHLRELADKIEQGAV